MSCLLHNKTKQTKNGQSQMTKNLWQRERKYLFNDLVRQYREEGYTQKEAKKLAKQEIDEVMEDKEAFVHNLWKESYTDV